MRLKQPRQLEEIRLKFYCTFIVRFVNLHCTNSGLRHALIVSFFLPFHQLFQFSLFFLESLPRLAFFAFLRL